MLGVVLTAAVTSVLWVLHRCQYGIDFSDEGFYLNWIARPWQFAYSVSQFGFVYHPLYRLVGGDLVALRQANALVTLGLSWALWVATLAKIAPGSGTVSPPRRFYLAATAFVFATVSLLSLLVGSMWLPTPSYNSLALQGILGAATGVVLAERRRSRLSTIGWTLIGVGGWITFMAKPTAAVALAVATLGYLIATNRVTLWRMMTWLAMTAALAWSSAWVIAGSLRAFGWRMFGGADEAARLGGGHTLARAFRWDTLSFGPPERNLFLGIAIVTGACVYGHFCAGRVRRSVAAIVTVLAATFAWTLCAGIHAPPVALKDSLGVLVGAVAMGSVAATLLVMPMREGSDRRAGLVASSGFAAVLPLVFAFGSGNNYWASASSAVVFWLLAGTFVMGLASRCAGFWPGVLAAAALAQCTTVVLLQIGMENPYRQPGDLSAYRERVTMGRSRRSLIVANTTADYIRRLRQLASDAGFRDGTPILDLTGRLPLALHVIGGQPVALAWMIGGYPGSAQVVERALDRVPCEDVGRAWVLAEPLGPRRLAGDLLRNHGVDMDRDFSVVGSLGSPIGEYPSAFQQVLLKPDRPVDVAQRACGERRTARAHGHDRGAADPHR